MATSSITNMRQNLRSWLQQVAMVGFIATTVGLPSIAFAAPGHAEHAGGVASLIPFFVSFGVFFGALYFLARKPVSKAWSARRITIYDEIESAQDKLKGSVKQYEAAEQDLTSLPQRIEELRKQIAAETEVEVQAVLAAAVRRAEQLKSEATKSISAERNKSLAAIREELVKEIVAEASKRLKASMTPDADRRLRAATLGHAHELHESHLLAGASSATKEVIH